MLKLVSAACVMLISPASGPAALSPRKMPASRAQNCELEALCRTRARIRSFRRGRLVSGRIWISSYAAPFGMGDSFRRCHAPPRAMARRAASSVRRRFAWRSRTPSTKADPWLALAPHGFIGLVSSPVPMDHDVPCEPWPHPQPSRTECQVYPLPSSASRTVHETCASSVRRAASRRWTAGRALRHQGRGALGRLLLPCKAGPVMRVR